MFTFTPQFISRVQAFFGSEMSSTLQEYLDDGDPLQVLMFLRGSHKWKDRDEAVTAIMTQPYLDVRLIAIYEQGLKHLADRCVMEMLDYQMIPHNELVP